MCRVCSLRAAFKEAANYKQRFYIAKSVIRIHLFESPSSQGEAALRVRVQLCIRRFTLADAVSLVRSPSRLYRSPCVHRFKANDWTAAAEQEATRVTPKSKTEEKATAIMRAHDIAQYMLIATRLYVS